MEILSHIIARTCSINIESANFLSVSAEFSVALNDLINRNKNIELQKSNILNTLHKSNLQIEDKSLNNVIQNIRRSIFNSRNIKEKDLNKIKALPTLYDEVASFVEIRESSQKKANLSILYKSELNKKRFEVYNQIQDPLLKNGLVLSSTDLLLAIGKPIPELLNKYNKKSKQIEVGILKYLTRSSLKPTPFSSFTQLTDVKIKATKNNKQFIEFTEKKEIKNSVRVNNYIFKKLKVILFNSDDIYFNLQVVLNPSIKYDSKKNLYKFLINKNNFEFFRDLTSNEVIQLIIEYVDSKNCTFEDVIDFCKNHINATTDDIKKYLKDLVNIGLLEFKLYASGTNIDWIDKLKRQIFNMPESDVKHKVLELLCNLESFRLKFEKSFNDAEERLVVLNEVYKIFNDEYGNLYYDIFPDRKEPRDDLTFIWKEKIFFEDTVDESEIEINSKILQKYISSADDLIRYSFLIAPRTYKQKKLYEFFKKSYNVETVALLKIYKDYYRQLKEEKSSEDTEGNSKVISETPNDTLRDFAIDVNEDIVNFKIKKSVTLPEIPKNYSSSMFFQLTEGENGEKIFVVNGLGYGYGQMSSRFLNLFEDDFTSEIRAKNKRLGDDGFLYAEVNDASYFNANLHPPLFDYECKIPGGHTNVAENRQLKVNNLNVRLNEKNQSLELFDCHTEKQVLVHDSCFQGIKGRSELFSLLLNFSNKVMSYHRRILNQINKAYHLKLSEKVFKYPRVIFNEHIILQRKYWLIINSDALVIKANESEIDYMIRILIWKDKYNIPNSVYVTLNYQDSSTNEKIFKRDDYKPQYIDFKNPIFIPLIIKLFRKVQSYKLSEALPDINDAVEINKGDKRTVEFLTQWYNGAEFK